MKSRAVVVPRADGERARRRFAEAGVLRDDLQIRSDAQEVVLPVRPGKPVTLDVGWRETEAELAAVTGSGAQSYRELLEWPEERAALLPRSFDVVGDVVVVRLPPELEKYGPEIGEALLRFVPAARVVAADHGVHGTERRRSLVRLAGSGGYATRHRENGLELSVDLERAYFSPRLAREHALVAAAVKPGDRVYDLCCGVGPFALTIARDGRAARVDAVDSNADAIELLGASLQRSGFADVVHPHVARVEEFLPAAGAVERVVLNLPHEGIKYLPLVAPVVRPLGRVYFYEVTERAEAKERGEAVVSSLGGPGMWTLEETHVVHPYSPLADLRAFVLERRVG